MEKQDLLTRIQNLPESTRLMILWGTIAVVSVGGFFWWAQRVADRVASAQGTDIGIEFPREQIQNDVDSLLQPFQGIEERIQEIEQGNEEESNEVDPEQEGREQEAIDDSTLKPTGTADVIDEDNTEEHSSVGE